MRTFGFRYWNTFNKDDPNMVYFDFWGLLGGKVYPDGPVMQYTGLEDKNGVLIFEGDIIEIKHPHKNRYYKGKIVFEHGSFIAADFFFAHLDNPSDFIEALDYVEVIGNIYENPSLL